MDLGVSHADWVFWMASYMLVWFGVVLLAIPEGCNTFLSIAVRGSVWHPDLSVVPCALSPLLICGTALAAIVYLK